MPEYSVKVEGLSKVQRMLQKADANKALVVGLEWGTHKLRNEVSVYAPPSEANYPHTKVYRSATGKERSVITWYDRGFGQRYGMEGRGKQTAYPLRDGWATKLFRGANPSGMVENTAPYAGYVQGSEKLQARIHNERGWKRLDEEGKKLAPKITQEIIRAFKELMLK